MKLEGGKVGDLVLLWQPDDEEENKESAQKHELRRGDLCPQCGKGRLDYDGLLNLSCTQCGFALVGCFT